ncbi:helix-turn-helix domain-containing protein [Runella salmonicolor]|uniref:AraC family transcriptional regulator n=1 Tax=Runella salmonicolor TaxID=2950278 RepID=A0ABT1FLA1_9BACT|nr:AraC family transcriptional regulator [Runella salmonicolor]MCP1382544.1 AraC family transcriptional regulator [Runella salmonicolor]
MLQILPPHPALRPFVKAYWYLHVRHTMPLVSLPIAPIPETALYFYPKDKLSVNYLDNSTHKIPDNIIIGQSTFRHNLLIPSNYIMFKVLLQPSGFFRLFGIPMTLFAGSYEEINLVLGNEIKEIRERIENAATFGEMVNITEGFLLRKIVDYKVEKHAIDAVLEQSNFYHFSLDQLAQDACLSRRQFERKFLERTGVSPKFYSRILRFNQAMKLKQKAPQLSWMHIAYDCGYFDHNHLLRDFKQFTGAVPSGFDFEKAVIY